jgi:hypothetical protein
MDYLGSHSDRVTNEQSHIAISSENESAFRNRVIVEESALRSAVEQANDWRAKKDEDWWVEWDLQSGWKSVQIQRFEIELS